MPTWPKPDPNHTDFYCCTAWHLKQSARCLAIYALVGQLTKSGKQPFFAKLTKLANYFDWSYETTRKSFHVLRKLGFIEAVQQKGYYRYVKHREWAEKYPNKCNARAVLPWQSEVDPLVGQMFAISGGKLRMMPHNVAALRKYADNDDKLILRLFQMEIDQAIADKALGRYVGNSANSCRYRVQVKLKNGWIAKHENH